MKRLVSGIFIMALTSVFAISTCSAFDPNNWDANKWEDVVAQRLYAGGKIEKQCGADNAICTTTVTSIPDQYGKIYQTMELSGPEAGPRKQWECTIEKRNQDIRICMTFWPDQWRADRLLSGGKYIVIGQGSYEEVVKAIGFEP